MLSKEEKKWFKKFQKEFFNEEEKQTLPDEIMEELIKIYLKQPEEIRKASIYFDRKAIEAREKSNWREYLKASLQILGIEVVEDRKGKIYLKIPRNKNDI